MPAPTVTAYQAVEHALNMMMDTLDRVSLLRLIAVVERVANGVQDREHLKAALQAFVEELTCYEEGPEETAP